MISTIVVLTFALAVIAARLFGNPDFARQPGSPAGRTPAWRTALARSL